MRLVFLKQEGGLIQGITLVVVDEDGGVAGVTLAMMIMVVEVGVEEVVVATVEGGPITLAVAEADGARVAVVALPGVVVVLVEDLMLLAGVELAMTATVAVEAAGDQLLVVLTVLVVALMTQDGVAPKRPSQHRMVEAAGGLAVVVAGDGCVLRCSSDDC